MREMVQIEEKWTASVSSSCRVVSCRRRRRRRRQVVIRGLVKNGSGVQGVQGGVGGLGGTGEKEEYQHM